MIVFALLCRYALAVIFGHSGAVKMVDLADFRLAVRNYDLVPERLLGAFAVGLPLAELACAALLIAGVLTGPAAALLVVMLAVFVFAISVNLLRGRTFSCGCSGKTSSDITWRHVIVNAVLAGLAALVSAWAVQPLTVIAGWGMGGTPALSAGDALGVLVAGGTVAALGLLIAEAFSVRRVLAVVGEPSADELPAEGVVP
ncbi:MAG TPA: MauE/DoxX family redox-associated membrane protein [Streptosporangiaceae bacterium]|nr:MauE/DoxX family redox-associated membrane protein [Streptosporangiaceae bacterium]